MKTSFFLDPEVEEPIVELDESQDNDPESNLDHLLFFSIMKN